MFTHWFFNLLHRLYLVDISPNFNSMTTPTQSHNPIEGMIEKIDSVIFQEGETIEHIDLNYSTFMYLVRQSILSAKEIGKKEGMELGRIAGVREAIAAQPRRRILLHSVVAKGSQEDLNDTWRKGYNEALDDYQSSLTNLLSLHE